MTDVRVRFAPSPTGGLHLGGVRTVLFNYLFAKQNGGKFIVRTEDTDRTRFVPGAEQYIFDCLQWCGLEPDESVLHGGEFGPYKQSERKEIYSRYAKQLIDAGHAYYAFDTPAELEAMRSQTKDDGTTGKQYDAAVRMKMRNSLTLSAEETQQLITDGTPHVVRIKVIPGETIQLNDLIRGAVEFHSDHVDDKVLLKADGMPTYHLAVVVDDFLMQITHAFRGEEWLPSAPVHVLLWKNLFGLDQMPAWAHLPLILKPDGHGKLSKRDGAKYGFPVYAMDWTDPETGETTKGFRERGFLPEAFLNFLALLGWSSGEEQEIFSIDELIQKFNISHIHKGGAKFDFDKAKWFNAEWIKRTDATVFAEFVTKDFAARGIVVKNDAHFLKVLELVKERCSLLTDFYDQAAYFFKTPDAIDAEAVRPKWNEQKTVFFEKLSALYSSGDAFTKESAEETFKNMAAEAGIKPGELQLPMRIMLVGGKFGPAVFEIAGMIGKEETIARINNGIKQILA